MCYTSTNLNGWFDDLLQAGERIATGITRQSTPAGYGTYGQASTPPMFPPSYGAPQPQLFSPGKTLMDSLSPLLPYLVIGGVLFYVMKGNGKGKR